MPFLSGVTLAKLDQNSEKTEISELYMGIFTSEGFVYFLNSVI